MQLDATDTTIVALLREDARLSFRELALRAGVSTPTAASRVRALEAMGVLKAYRAVLDGALLGTPAYVLDVEARPAEIATLAAALAAEEGVDEVLQLAGGRVHVRLRLGASALQGLLARLDARPEVARYAVHPVVEAHEAARPATTLDVDVRCHECKGPIHGAGVHKRWAEEGSRDHWFCCRGCSGAYEKRLLATLAAAKKRR